MKTKYKILLIFLLIIFVVVGSIFYLILRQRALIERTSSTEDTSQIPINQVCFSGSAGSNSDYPYEIYTIKLGDSLNSIAKNELGDSTRLNEIVILNEEAYPTLASQPSYLEAGWKFKLPPKDIIIEWAKQLAEFSGQIVFISSDIIKIRITPNLTQATYVYPVATSKYYSNEGEIQFKDLKLGNCASVVVRQTISKPNQLVRLTISSK